MIGLPNRGHRLCLEKLVFSAMFIRSLTGGHWQ
jgi:hypothetical protein